MRILAADGLDEGHGRQIASAERAEEVIDVVLMIRCITRADATDGPWTDMVGIGRRGVVLERLVMGHIVAFVDPGYRGGGIALTTGRTVGIDDTQIESALEPSPSDARAVEQVTNVWSAQLNFVTGRGRTNVANRVGITDKRQTAIAIAYPVT